MMLLWIIPIGILTYYLWYHNEDPRWSRREATSAEDQLKRRLANGEITIQEYRDIRQTLEEDK